MLYYIYDLLTLKSYTLHIKYVQSDCDVVVHLPFCFRLSVRISICTVQDTNNLGCILRLKCSHLSALSNGDPVKSKKLRYSDATNWLNSLLQQKETRKRGIVGMNENCFTVQYARSHTNAHFLPRCRATSQRLKPSRKKSRLASRLAASVSTRQPLARVSVLPLSNVSTLPSSESHSASVRLASLG